MSGPPLVKLFEFLFKYQPQSTRKLSQNKQNQIMVANLCSSAIVSQWIRATYSTHGGMYLDPDSRLFLALIPSGSEVFTNLFCCNLTMEQVYSKFSNFGLAFEGCFDIHAQFNAPNIFKGYVLPNDSIEGNIAISDPTIVSMKTTYYAGPNPSNDPHQGFLIVDDHKHLTITDLAGLRTYKAKGIVTQYIEGRRLFTGGLMTADYDNMLDLELDVKGQRYDIPGADVEPDYPMLRIRIGREYHNFSEIGKTIHFKHPELFSMRRGMLVLGIDQTGNTFVVYHKLIDMYGLLCLLNAFKTRDAILLCISDSASILWRESGTNTFNKTDFIGNPLKPSSSIVAFAA